MFKAVTATLPPSYQEVMVQDAMKAMKNKISQEVAISTEHLARRLRAYPKIVNIQDQINVESHGIVDILFPTTHVTHRREQNHEFINQLRGRLYDLIELNLRANIATETQNRLYTICEEPRNENGDTAAF